MKKESIGKVSRNKARSKAENAELFRLMLKAPHLVATPEKYKGTRQSNKRRAIDEQL